MKRASLPLRRRDFIGLVGGAAMLPLVARAAPAIPVVGYLSSGVPEQAGGQLKAFRDGLGEAGYVEGRNVVIEYRWGDGYDRMAAMASELVAQNVAVLVAAGGIPSAKAAMQATTTIPIVFSVGADPVKFGLVTSLNRPDGNVTGVTNFNLELSQKRLELLHDVIPGAKRIALLVNPKTPLAVPMVSDMETAVRLKGLELKVLNSTSEQEIEAAFAALAEWRADALVVGADAYFAGKGNRIATLASRQSLAVIGSFPDLPRAGGLMSYGGSAGEQWRLLGAYAGKILSGVKPADLPIQQSTKLELVINVKTAKALGLTVPVSLLSSADEVIE